MTDSMRLDSIHPFISDRKLLDQLADTPLNDTELARIDGLRNEFEAEMVRDALDKEGIFALVQSNRETALSGMFIPQLLWGSIIVRKDQAEQALGVLRSVRDAYAGDDDPDQGQPADAASDEAT